MYYITENKVPKATPLLRRFFQDPLNHFYVQIDLQSFSCWSLFSNRSLWTFLGT